MVALLPRESLGIESSSDPFPAPAKTGIAGPITLAPFHSLSPPGQTETNACRIKVLSSPMVQGLVAWAASAEQVIGPAWILQGPSLTLREPETALQGRKIPVGPKATNGFLFAGQGLLCTVMRERGGRLDTRLLLVPQLDGGDLIRVGSVRTGPDSAPPEQRVKIVPADH